MHDELGVNFKKRLTLMLRRLSEKFESLFGINRALLEASSTQYKTHK